MLHQLVLFAPFDGMLFSVAGISGKNEARKVLLEGRNHLELCNHKRYVWHRAFEISTL